MDHPQVVAAKVALERGMSRQEVEARYLPGEKHELAQRLIARSKEIAEGIPNMLLPPSAGSIVN